MIISLRFNRITASRKPSFKESTEAKNNLKIIDITEHPLDDLTKKQKAAAIDFSYTVEFAPAVAKIELAGTAVYANTEEKINTLIKTWKKESKMEKEFIPPIFNYLLSKCNIRSLAIEEELGLPFHFPLPRLRTNNAKENQQAAAS